MASIRERHSDRAGTTYSVLYRHAGKQRSQTFDTLPAAEKFQALVDLIGPEKALATYAISDSPTLTLDQLAEMFFEWKAGDVTPRTLADYRRDYANWIKPTLGHRIAETVDERDVQTLVDSMSKQLDAKSVKGRHVLLGSIYRYGSARSRRLVPHNPCLETQLPKQKRKPPKGFTMPEWTALYEANRDSEPDATDLALFLLLTGWRFSEATALPPGAVEDYGDQMFVAVTQVNRRDGSLRFVIVQDAKNYTSLRRLEVTPATAAVVRRRMAGKAPTDLVFTNQYGRRWNQTNFLNRTWTTMLKNAGLPHEGEGRKTPHALRHTHVAMLDRAGATLPQMSRRAGHTNIQTTINVYGGMIDSIGADVLREMDALALPQSAPAIGEVVRGELG